MLVRFLSRLTSRFREKKGDAMCFAGIEENVRQLLKRRELAEETAARGEGGVINASTARVRPNALRGKSEPGVGESLSIGMDGRAHHSHLHVLVEDQGWIRSVDLLEQQKTEGFEPVTRPAALRPPRQVALSAGRS